GGERGGTRRRGTRGRRPRTWRRRHVRDRRGTTLSAHQIALGGELLVGQHHGVARHAQVSRERACGRHARGGAESAVADLGLQRQVHAAMERTGRLAQAEQHDASPWSGWVWPLRSFEIWPFHRASIEPRIRVRDRRRKEEASMADALETLQALNRGYLLAAEKSDVAWYTEHLAEDYRATNPDGTFVDKAGFLARIGRPHTIKNLRAPEV